MNIRTDFKKYTDAFGLVQGKPGEMSGNGLLFTGEYLMLLSRLSLLTVDDMRAFQSSVIDCEKDPGLLMRHPVAYTNDQEGPDDYIGVAAGASVTDPEIARRILLYGRCHYFHWGPFRFAYYFRNEEPHVDDDVRAWLGRQPSTIAHLEFASGKKPPFWRQVAWALAVSSTGVVGPGPRENGGQDTWILSWLLVETYRTVTAVKPELSSFPCELAVKSFERRLSTVWPDGMGAVFSQYFQNPDHPLAKYFPKPNGGEVHECGLCEVREHGVPGEDEPSNRVVQEMPTGEVP